MLRISVWVLGGVGNHKFRCEENPATHDEAFAYVLFHRYCLPRYSYHRIQLREKHPRRRQVVHDDRHLQSHYGNSGKAKAERGRACSKCRGVVERKSVERYMKRKVFEHILW